MRYTIVSLPILLVFTDCALATSLSDEVLQRLNEGDADEQCYSAPNDIECLKSRGYSCDSISKDGRDAYYCIRHLSDSFYDVTVFINERDWDGSVSWNPKSDSTSSARNRADAEFQNWCFNHEMVPACLSLVGYRCSSESPEYTLFVCRNLEEPGLSFRLEKMDKTDKFLSLDRWIIEPFRSTD